ncbi:MAG TPA: flavodoxin domain-containing protein [Ktedonobacterales bacterium]
MNSMVIYATRYGNTGRIAEAIAEGLRPHGDVSLLPMDEVSAIPSNGIDLMVVGGPTEGHGMTDPVARFFDHLDINAMHGKAIVAFDTRFRWPRWLSGSAGAAITRRLRRMGAHVVAPPESFFVAGGINSPVTDEPLLEPGETERATSWAATLAAVVEKSTPGALSGAS